MADRLQIAPRHRRILEALLRKDLPGVEVWAYGSRVNGLGHDGSDLDLVLRAPDLQKLPAGQLLDFNDAIRDSTIPFLVEARDWACLPERFHQEIERDYVVMSDGSEPEPEPRGAEAPAMPLHRVPLRNLCEAIVDCPHSTPAWMADGVVVLRSKNIRDGRLDLSQPSYTSEKDYAQRIKRATPRAGDLVITREAPMGEVCMIPQGLRCCLGQRMVLLRPSLAATDPRYLLYALQSESVQQEIRSHDGTGSTVSNLRISLLKDLRIPDRPLSEQRAIANVLGKLDDKIELNRRMNATLEAMARALFKSWFVDFDPVRAKMEGRDAGLPKDVADLFPDRLVDSELGEIPEGWKSKRLDNIATITKGRSYRRRELVASDTALVTLKSFARGGGYRAEGLKPFSGAYKSEQVVQPGEVIVACTDVTQAGEVVGRSAVVGETSSFRTLVASLDVLVVRPTHAALERAFVYYVTGTEDFVAHALARTTGTTVLHLSKAAVASFRLALPPRPLLVRFGHCANSIRARIQDNASAVGALTDLRDTLLPKLIAGEIRVRDAEKLVGAVA